MRRSFAIGWIFALALASPANAQNQTTPGAAQLNQSFGGFQAPAQGTVLPGTVQPAQPQAQAQPAQRGPSASVKSTHGSWTVRCFAPSECVMTQRHRRTPSTADAVLTIIRPQGLNDPQGNQVQALAEIIVPLGVYLPNGIGLQVDGREPRAAPFERCISDGCVVRAPITGTMLDQLKAGGTANLILSGSPTQVVNIPISLSGFTAAFNDLQ